MREPLLTQRLTLRDIAEADAELLFDLDSDAEVSEPTVKSARAK